MKHIYFSLILLFSVSFAFGQTATYTNTSSITIVDNSTASAYSSDIMVSGFTGTVSSVAVTINNFTHGAPSDVAICLEGPSGQKLLLQDGMWGTPATDISYMISDLGSNQPSQWDLASSGTYRPTSNTGLVSFNAPGPGTTYSNPGPASAGTTTMAAAFGGLAPNGTWKLWIVDVTGGDAGMISGGWELTLNPNTVLPVKLADLNASCESGNLLNVSWTTYNEQNSKDFTIQVSSDGNFFEDAETIKASGNSQIEMTYKATVPMPFAKTFVRLKLADLNEQYSYSEVVEANCSTNLPIVVRSQLVDQGYFMIDNPNGEFMQYIISDLNGKIIKKGTSKSIHHRVDFDDAHAAGLYILKVSTTKGEQDFKLNKQ